MTHGFIDRYAQPMQSLLDSWFAKALIGACGVLFAFDKTLILLLVVLITIDTITGMIAARRKGLPITSLGMRRTMPKVVDFGLFIIACTAIARGFPNTLGWLDSWAIMYAVANELKSIIENIFPAESVAILRRFRFIKQWQSGDEDVKLTGEAEIKDHERQTNDNQG